MLREVVFIDRVAATGTVDGGQLLDVRVLREPVRQRGLQIGLAWGVALVDVVGWLAEQDGPQQKADVLKWAQGRRVQGYAASTLWEKVAQPGLKELQAAGIVERTPNVGYEIVEDSGGEEES